MDEMQGCKFKDSSVSIFVSLWRLGLLHFRLCGLASFSVFLKRINQCVCVFMGDMHAYYSSSFLPPKEIK